MTKGRSATTRAWSFLLATALIFSSCSGAGDNGSAGGTVESLLALVPDTPDTRGEIFVNDHTAALELLDLSWPEDNEGQLDVLRTMTLGTENLRISMRSRVFGDMANDFTAWEEEVGFSIVDANSDLLTGVPPDQLFVASTNLDAESITEIAASYGPWSNDVRTETTPSDLSYLAWGDPSEIIFDRRSPVRELGRGGTLYVTNDGDALRSPSPELLELAIDAEQGDQPSLADDEDFSAIARVLDGKGVVQALLSNRRAIVSPLGPGDLADADEVAEFFDNLVVLPGYRAVGIGVGFDQTASPSGVLTLVFATSSPEDAEATVEAMERIVADSVSLRTDEPWTNVLSVRSTETDGNIAIVELTTERPGIGFDAFYQQDTLFASG